MPVRHAGLVGCAIVGIAAHAQAQPMDEERAEMRYFTAKLSAGPTVQTLYGNLVYGGDFILALGSNTNGYAGHYHSCVNVIIARTLAGLQVQEVRFCALHEWSIDRVRLGFSPDLGFMFVHRKTRDASMRGFMMGMSPHATVDLAQFDDTRHPAALYFGLRATVDFPFDGWHAAGGAALGIRY